MQASELGRLVLLCCGDPVPHKRPFYEASKQSNKTCAGGQIRSTQRGKLAQHARRHQLKTAQ